MITTKQDKLKHFENKLGPNVSLQRATSSECSITKLLVSIYKSIYMREWIIN